MDERMTPNQQSCSQKWRSNDEHCYACKIFKLFIIEYCLSKTYWNQRHISLKGLYYFERWKNWYHLTNLSFIFQYYIQLTNNKPKLVCQTFSLQLQSIQTSLAIDFGTKLLPKTLACIIDLWSSSPLFRFFFYWYRFRPCSILYDMN